MEQILTKDLILRKAKFSDAKSLYKNYWSKQEPTKYMLWKRVESFKDAKLRIKKSIEFQKNKDAFIIVEKSSGEAIGLAGFLCIEDGVYDDCGIGIGPEYIRKSYGTQILKGFLKYLFETKNAKLVICSAMSENIPSIKLQEKCGFRFVKEENKTRVFDGYQYVCRVHEMTKEEYQKIYLT